MSGNRTYKDACSLTQAKGLPSLIYHEPALEMRFMRGAAGATRILTIRALLEKHRSYLRQNRDDTEKQVLGIPLRKANQLAFIAERAEAWAKANKDRIDKRYAEQEQEE